MSGYWPFQDQCAAASKLCVVCCYWIMISPNLWHSIITPPLKRNPGGKKAGPQLSTGGGAYLWRGVRSRRRPFYASHLDQVGALCFDRETNLSTRRCHFSLISHFDLTNKHSWVNWNTLTVLIHIVQFHLCVTVALSLCLCLSPRRLFFEPFPLATIQQYTLRIGDLNKYCISFPRPLPFPSRPHRNIFPSHVLQPLSLL